MGLMSPTGSVVTRFEQSVSSLGYQFIHAEIAADPEPETRYLRVVRAEGQRLHFVAYDPMHDDGYEALFRTFAEIDPTEEGILGFANRYGTLGEHVVYKPNDNYWVSVESLHLWVGHITNMRNLLHLWDLACVGDVQRLGAMVEHVNPEWLAKSIDHPWRHFHVPGDNRSYVGGRYRIEKKAFDRFADDDVVHQALEVVQQEINQQLHGRVNPALEFVASEDRLRFAITPRNLLGALWLQFALAVDGNKQYRRCQTCNSWLLISPDTNRTNREYCSDACRAKAYRERKKRAKEMREAGTDISDIAAQLGVDLRSVQKWVLEP